MTPDQMLTQKQLSAEAREVPDGYELVAVEAGPEWRIDPGRPCRRLIRHWVYCREPSVFSINRGYSNSRYPARWAYCLTHGYGKWVESDRVMTWILREKTDAI